MGVVAAAYPWAARATRRSGSPCRTRALLDTQGRSVGTAQTYAGRLALFLTWATATGTDPAAPTVDQLAGFARWLERTPSRKHRPGQRRRRAADAKVVAFAPARSAPTVEGDPRSGGRVRAFRCWPRLVRPGGRRPAEL